MDDDWKVKTSICWGQRDRWLDFDGVEDFCTASKHRLVELPTVPTIILSVVLLSAVCCLLSTE